MCLAGPLSMAGASAQAAHHKAMATRALLEHKAFMKKLAGKANPDAVDLLWLDNCWRPVFDGVSSIPKVKKRGAAA